MEDFLGYSREMPDFFHALSFNNNREWFSAHKDDYERLVVLPSLALIARLDPVVRSLSPYYTGIPRKLGGSLMRLYRDTRFSKDKTPYKTNIGIQLRHQWAKDVHAPGFYLHFDTSSCFFGAGTWRPDSSSLLKIRNHIADSAQDYRNALQIANAQAGLKVEGDRLKKVPRGFSPEHNMSEDLKLLDFLVSKPIPQEVFFTEELVGVMGVCMKASAPYLAFLCHGLEVPF